jgi:hypothetical protein
MLERDLADAEQEGRPLTLRDQGALLLQDLRQLGKSLFRFEHRKDAGVDLARWPVHLQEMTPHGQRIGGVRLS